MRLSPTLSFYLGRHFVTALLAVGSSVLLLIYVGEALELIRRFSGKGTPLKSLFVMAFYKLPEVGQAALPFIVLFSSMYALWRLTRSHELIVIRSSGVSVWQFLLPLAVSAIITGLIATTLINPLSAAMLAKYDRLDSKLSHGQTISFDISKSGLWLRQPYSDGHALIYAQSINSTNLTLWPVTVFFFKGEDTYAGRIDAQTAQLQNQYWELHQVQVKVPQKPSETRGIYRLPTSFTLSRIQESFAPPETLSFWELPHFIATLKSMGLSSLRHQMYFQSLLAQPFLFCAMVFLAAAFAPKNLRRGGALIAVVGALALGFVFYFMSKFSMALGMSGNVPFLIAGWAPTAATLMLGVAALLKKEDG